MWKGKNELLKIQCKIKRSKKQARKIYDIKKVENNIEVKPNIPATTANHCHIQAKIGVQILRLKTTLESQL